jgi:hypothetical protein
MLLPDKLVRTPHKRQFLLPHMMHAEYPPATLDERTQLPVPRINCVE